MGDSIYAKEKNKGQCIVFDFDCTLTYTHYFYFLNMFDQYVKNSWYEDITKNKKLITTDELDKIAFDVKKNGGNTKGEYLITKTDKSTLINIFFGGITRFERLMKMFETLYDELEYDIYISSRGQCENILSLVYAVGIAKYIVEIDAHTETGNKKCKENGGKVEYISGILSQKYYNIMYVDDDNTEYMEIKHDTRSRHSDIKYYGYDEINLKNNHFGLDINMIEYIEKEARTRKNTLIRPQASELTAPIEILNPAYSSDSWKMSPDYSVFDSGRRSPIYTMFKTNNVTSLSQSKNIQSTRDELHNSDEIDLNVNMVINKPGYINTSQGGAYNYNNTKKIDEQYYKHKYLKYKQKYLAEKAKYLSKHT